jgi:hypothetical protein
MGLWSFYLGFQGRSTRLSNVWQTIFERMMCEATRVKLKKQWRAQKIRDSRNMDYLLRKASGRGSTRESPCRLQLEKQ